MRALVYRVHVCSSWPGLATEPEIIPKEHLQYCKSNKEILNAVSYTGYVVVCFEVDIFQKKEVLFSKPVINKLLFVIHWSKNLW